MALEYIILKTLGGDCPSFTKKSRYFVITASKHCVHYFTYHYVCSKITLVYIWLWRKIEFMASAISSIFGHNTLYHSSCYFSDYIIGNDNDFYDYI